MPKSFECFPSPTLKHFGGLRACDRPTLGGPGLTWHVVGFPQHFHLLDRASRTGNTTLFGYEYRALVSAGFDGHLSYSGPPKDVGYRPALSPFPSYLILFLVFLVDIKPLRLKTWLIMSLVVTEHLSTPQHVYTLHPLHLKEYTPEGFWIDPSAFIAGSTSDCMHDLMTFNSLLPIVLVSFRISSLPAQLDR